MPDQIPLEARFAPAATRNRDAILDVLRAHLPDTGSVLEIAAGTGEHAVHFAAALPGLRWRPADADAEARASIAAWRNHAGTPNLLAPIPLDARCPGSWRVDQADAVVCINMVHISPWDATTGLMTGASQILSREGVLYLYGPFVEADRETAPSNEAFDRDLRRRDPRWGLRHLDELDAAARGEGLKRHARVAMPANNLSLVYRRV